MGMRLLVMFSVFFVFVVFPKMGVLDLGTALSGGAELLPWTLVLLRYSRIKTESIS